MSWIKPRSVESSLELIRDLSSACSLLGGHHAKKLNQLLQEGDFLSVIDYVIPYDDPDLTVTDAIYSRQIQGFLQKQDFLELGVDKEQVAFRKFVESEQKCRETNLRLCNPTSLNRDVSAVLHYAQRKIVRVLGTVPNLDRLTFAFGPGANTSVKAASANFRVKLSAALECSANLLPFVGDLLAEVPLWTSHHSTNETEESYFVDVKVSSGKLQFVPKTCKTHRSIVVEPLLNGFYQKGIGSYIRDRLLLEGVDLRDQTRNQSLAKRGSIDGTIATIDLSSASDCISRNLVWHLLPYDWAEFLNHGRTDTVCYNDELIRLHKFSSMGNAYTFELESLIFFSICYGVCKHLDLSMTDVSVYGDDIIIPTEGADLLIETLRDIGFSTNNEKSFVSGPFRESCGADYLSGIDIRPFYLRRRVSEQVLYTMHNWFIRHGEYELAAIVYASTRSSYRLHGPDGYGDGHLIGSYHLRRPRYVVRRGWDGGFFDTYSLRSRFMKKLLPGDWLVPSYSVYTRAGSLNATDPDIVRGSRGYTKMSIYTLSTRIFSSGS